eukprot:TRINITY_DN10144_c0_g1_i1.p1 TRINITY_DN10144_c0_g1~~TRINITY_DN10144_c0_g1_i1.p1  ORF type:complete len:312 (+),score=37.94 TRINITY_DN10144_c0_g1_i1:115-1050(+)
MTLTFSRCFILLGIFVVVECSHGTDVADGEPFAVVTDDKDSVSHRSFLALKALNGQEFRHRPAKPESVAKIAAGDAFRSYPWWCLIWSLCAFLYWRGVVSRIPKINPPQQELRADFTRGCDACCSNTTLCCFTIFCSPIRQAHNAHVTGVMDFWMAFLVQLLCGFFTGCCGPCIVQMWFRQNIKAHLRIQPACASDLFLAGCCQPCAIGQAALEVDQMSGIEPVCFWQPVILPQARQPGIVGTPVVVSASATPVQQALPPVQQALPKVISVQVPEGASPGSIVQITAPSGQLMQVVVPENKMPGDIFQVQV